MNYLIQSHKSNNLKYIPSSFSAENRNTRGNLLSFYCQRLTNLKDPFENIAPKWPHNIDRKQDHKDQSGGDYIMYDNYCSMFSF